MFYIVCEDPDVYTEVRACDIPEEQFARFAGMNPHVIHFESH